MMVMGGMVVIFFGLLVYVLIICKDFSFMGGFLMVGILVVFLVGFVVMFFLIFVLFLMVLVVFVLLMLVFILYEMSNIIYGGEMNYVMVIVMFFVVIFNFFISFL